MKTIDITAYRPTKEQVTLRSWLLIPTLTHFEATAHIVDGIAYAEIDFAYGGPIWCIRVYAEQPHDVDYFVENIATDEWDTALASEVVYKGEGGPITLEDLTPLARTFVEMHFWNDEA